QSIHSGLDIALIERYKLIDAGVDDIGKDDIGLIGLYTNAHICGLNNHLWNKKIDIWKIQNILMSAAQLFNLVFQFVTQKPRHPCSEVSVAKLLEPLKSGPDISGKFCIGASC